MSHEQFPPRPDRRELFYIAERYVERLHKARANEPDCAQSGDMILRLTANPMTAPAALGIVATRVIGRLRERRHTRQEVEDDWQKLTAELICRDESYFNSVLELAQYIIRNERPYD